MSYAISVAYMLQNLRNINKTFIIIKIINLILNRISLPFLNDADNNHKYDSNNNITTAMIIATTI